MTYDCIVAGIGGVGSATLWHLASKGLRVLGIDRFAPGHNLGSSHGRTRIIRQAYFEHPNYVPLLLRAYQLWHELEAQTKQQLYFETGLLQVGPENGIVVPGVLRSAAEHQLEVDRLQGAEIEKRFPGFRVRETDAGVFERRAGYLLVEPCVQAHAQAAEAAGAKFEIGAEVVNWSADAEGVTVVTNRGTYRAARLIITGGSWNGELLCDLNLGLEVRRMPQFWFKNDSPALTEAAGCPTFLFELPTGVYYGFPDMRGWGVKAASHSRGETVADPLQVSRELRESDQREVYEFLSEHLPGVRNEVLYHEVCLYTMSPDEHFFIDSHPSFPQVAFAAGLSGHGFKFTSVLGEVLAQFGAMGELPDSVAFLRVGNRVPPRPGDAGASG